MRYVSTNSREIYVSLFLQISCLRFHKRTSFLAHLELDGRKMRATVRKQRSSLNGKGRIQTESVQQPCADPMETLRKFGENGLQFLSFSLSEPCIDKEEAV